MWIIIMWYIVWFLKKCLNFCIWFSTVNVFVSYSMFCLYTRQDIFNFLFSTSIQISCRDLYPVSCCWGTRKFFYRVLKRQQKISLFRTYIVPKFCPCWWSALANVPLLTRVFVNFLHLPASTSTRARDAWSKSRRATNRPHVSHRKDWWPNLWTTLSGRMAAQTIYFVFQQIYRNPEVTISTAGVRLVLSIPISSNLSFP